MFVYFENENDTHVVVWTVIVVIEYLCVCVFCILRLSSCIKSISMTHCVIDTGPIVDQTKVDMASL